MSQIKIAVVGCGHLGSIHARLLAARTDVELVAVVDPVPESRQRVAEAYGCRALAEPQELCGVADAVVVAAPTYLHAAVSVPLLEAGLDLLIEKPIAATVAEAQSIVTVARRHGRVVAVGHVERFNPAWQMAVERCGRVVAVESSRLAPFTFRSLDVGVVLDLMIHDIDLVLSLEPGELVSVESHGLSATGGHEDAVRARLLFSSGMIADLSASRIHPTPTSTPRRSRWWRRHQRWNVVNSSPQPCRRPIGQRSRTVFLQTSCPGKLSRSPRRMPSPASMTIFSPRCSRGGRPSCRRPPARRRSRSRCGCWMGLSATDWGTRHRSCRCRCIRVSVPPPSQAEKRPELAQSVRPAAAAGAIGIGV